MGRQAHQLRVALGLSADRAPNWATLTDHYELVPDSMTAEPARYAPVGHTRSIVGNQLYDDRGRPVNKLVRQQDDEQCRALNHTVDYAVCRIRDNAITNDVSVLKEILEDEEEFEAHERQYMFGIEALGILSNYVAVAWIRSLRYQLLMYPATDHMTLTELVVKNASYEGIVPFALLGLTSELVKYALVKRRQSVDEWFERRRKDHFEGYLGQSVWLKAFPYVEHGFDFFESLCLYTPIAVYQRLQCLRFVPVRRSWFPILSMTGSVNILRGGSISLWRSLASTALMQGTFFWASDKIMKITSTYLSTIIDAPMTSRYYKSMKAGIKSIIESEVQVFRAIPPVQTGYRTFLRGLTAACRGIVQFLSWQPKPTISNNGEIIHRRRGELRNFPNTILAGRLTTFIYEVSLVGVQAFISRRWAAAFLELRRLASVDTPLFLHEIYPPRMFSFADKNPGTPIMRWNSIGKVGITFAVQAALSLVAFTGESAVIMWLGKTRLRWA